MVSSADSNQKLKTAAITRSFQNTSTWPKEITEIYVKSSLDATSQTSLFYEPFPSRDSSRPLLVALHTWSTDYKSTQGQTSFAEWCIRHGWFFLHPNFRGPNTNPSACGSIWAIQDVVDAVEYVCHQAKVTTVDPKRIYVVGVSGGGHMALLLAARHSTLWAGVSVWAPISDVHAWWQQRAFPKSRDNSPKAFMKYARNIENVVGGTPNDNEAAYLECQKRSPLTYLSPETANAVNLDINAGILDGRGSGGSVPFTHSLHAFNQLCPKDDKFTQRWINEFYETQQCPSNLYFQANESEEDFLFQGRTIYFRRVQDSARVTIFEGGHEVLHVAALNWLKQQQKGQLAKWRIPHSDVDLFYNDRMEMQSGN